MVDKCWGGVYCLWLGGDLHIDIEQRLNSEVTMSTFTEVGSLYQ